MNYRAEADALDTELRERIDAWHARGTQIGETEFNDLALRTFAHQLRYNAPYERYARTFGFTESALPGDWRSIPPVPAAAFKEATLATFDAARAQLAFATSGTTHGVRGRHYMEKREMYDAALLAGFDRFVLSGAPRLRYLNLVPNPSERPDSSLGYMMARVSAQRGDAHTGWYVRGDALHVDDFFDDLQTAISNERPVCIAATAFALVDVLDAMHRRNLTLPLPPSSRIMETGGFKGRSRVVSRNDLYRGLRERFAIAPAAIVAEYGMTELTSQYYDAALEGDRQSGDSSATRIKRAPPWLRSHATGVAGETLPDGTVGALVHLDLANRSSCVAVQTEDLGAMYDGGLILIGRDTGAELRGCSLDAEDLIRR